MTTTNILFTKICQGYYACSSTKGDYKIERMKYDFQPVVWNITYPGRQIPDECFSTLRDAKDEVIKDITAKNSAIIID